MVNITTYEYPTNLTDISDIIGVANNYTHVAAGQYLLGPVLLFLLFGVVLLTLLQKKQDAASSISASLWVTTIAGIFLSLMPNMLNPSYVLGLGAASALSAILLWTGSK